MAIRKLLNSLVLLATLGPAASGQFSLFEWTLVGPPGGSATLTDTDMHIVGLDGPGISCPGGLQDLYYEAVATQDGTIEAFLVWDNLDIGYHWDFPAIYIDGVRTIIGDVGTSFPFSAPIGFDVQAGQRFGLGVYSLDCWNLPGIADFSQFTFTSEQGSVCQVNLGFGGPGRSALSVCGDPLQAGGTVDVVLSGAPANTTAYLVLGLSKTPTPFAGGLIVPLPIQRLMAYPTDGSGNLLLSGVGGGGGPVTAFLQAVVVDPVQPFGYGLSNAVQLEVLP